MSVGVNLQGGIAFDDAIPYINSNFEGAVQDIADLKVTLGSSGQFTYDDIPSGVQQNFPFVQYTTTAAAQVGGILSAYSIFIDSPQLAAYRAAPTSTLNLSSLDPADLWPSGANITPAKKALVQFGNMFDSTDNYFNSLYAGHPEQLTFVSSVDGKRYYALRFIYVVTIRNLDVSQHSYLIVPNFKYLTAPQQSQFR